MRLINAKTLMLEDFSLKPKPEYAILSHTWEVDEEVTYQEFLSHSHRHKKGWTKIRRSCKLALRDRLEYVWIDTCCIDKSSSAELSEAINSMFAWYKGASRCYALLSDLPADDHTELEMCRWWTRGWTLQELIAPRHLTFYDENCGLVGSKEELCCEIQLITGIPWEVLRPARSRWAVTLDEIPVAKRMSWAAKRFTTRPEDEAYCLLGIFNISMPLIYGEGSKAFLRLQEEIVKHNNDTSVFAGIETRETPGYLSSSPHAFAHCASFEDSVNTMSDYERAEFSLTNRGVRFSSKTRMMVISQSEENVGNKQIYALRIGKLPHDKMAFQDRGIYLCLRKIAPALYEQHPDFPCAVIRPQSAQINEHSIVEKTLCLLPKFSDIWVYAVHNTHTVNIPKFDDIELLDVAPQRLWDVERRWIKNEPGGTHKAEACSRLNMALMVIKTGKLEAKVLVYWHFIPIKDNVRSEPVVRLMAVDTLVEDSEVWSLFSLGRRKPLRKKDFFRCYDTTSHGSTLNLTIKRQTIKIGVAMEYTELEPAEMYTVGLCEVTECWKLVVDWSLT